MSASSRRSARTAEEELRTAAAAAIGVPATQNTPSAQTITLPILPAQPTRNMTRLAAQPAVRTAVAREGRNVTTTRSTNLEALLGQMTGTDRTNAPCTHCAAGAGTWTTCVTVPNMFGGSCANCHYGSEGSRCSFRPVYTDPRASVSDLESPVPDRRRRPSRAGSVTEPGRVVRRRAARPGARARRLAALFSELSHVYSSMADDEEDDADLE